MFYFIFCGLPSAECKEMLMGIAGDLRRVAVISHE